MPQMTDWRRVLQIAGAFMAYLIGSGFATGQEALQFFAGYGLYGAAGALVSLFLFIFACNTLLQTGRQCQLVRNEDVFRHFCGDILGRFLTWYTMVFIVAVHAVMLSGAGAVMQQAYGIPAAVGSAAMALFSMATLLLGLRRILDVMGIVGPLIVLLTISVAVLTLVQNGAEVTAGAAVAGELDILRASPHWLLSALLYIAMTLPGMASFLPAVGATVASQGDLKRASLLGPVAFITAMVLVVLALLTRLPQVYQAEVPIMSLATEVFPAYGMVFALVIFLGIYTTVTPLLWTVCVRFADEGGRRYRLLVVGLTLVGLVGGSLLPFGKLVNLIYPTVGYAGLLLLVCMLWRRFRAGNQRFAGGAGIT